MVLTVVLPVLPLSPGSPRRRSSLAARRNFVAPYLQPPAASGAADDAVRGDRIGSSGWRLEAWHSPKAKVATDQEAIASLLQLGCGVDPAGTRTLSDKRQRTTTASTVPAIIHRGLLLGGPRGHGGGAGRRPVGVPRPPLRHGSTSPARPPAKKITYVKGREEASEMRREGAVAKSRNTDAYTRRRCCSPPFPCSSNHKVAETT